MWAPCRLLPWAAPPSASLHERKLLVDGEQRSLCEVFGRGHRRVVQQNLALQLGERHQRLEETDQTRTESANPNPAPQRALRLFTQSVRRSSASGSSVASFRFSKLMRSLGRWFQANSTASWKVVTSRSYWPTSFLKVIWRREAGWGLVGWVFCRVCCRSAALTMPLDMRWCQCSFLPLWFFL